MNRQYLLLGNDKLRTEYCVGATNTHSQRMATQYSAKRHTKHWYQHLSRSLSSFTMNGNRSNAVGEMYAVHYTYAAVHTQLRNPATWRGDNKPEIS